MGGVTTPPSEAHLAEVRDALSAFDTEYGALLLGNRTVREYASEWALVHTTHGVEEWLMVGLDDPDDVARWVSAGLDFPLVVEHYMAEGIEPVRAAELFDSGDLDNRDDIEEELAEVLRDRPARDIGVALLAPLSTPEFASIETILSELWKALDQDGLSEVHQAQIVAMAELIKIAQLEAVPGETPRWKVVGTVRAALRYLAKDVPKDALAWWKLIELLEQIDWTTIAGELPGL